MWLDRAPRTTSSEDAEPRTMTRTLSPQTRRLWHMSGTSRRLTTPDLALEWAKRGDRRVAMLADAIATDQGPADRVICQ